MSIWGDFKLRKVEQHDLSIILGWRNSDRIRKSMYNEHIISLPEHQAWHDRLQVATDRKALVFEYKGKPLGLVSFTQIDQYNGTALWGYYIGEVNAPQGVAMIMGILAIEYVFEKMNIRKISSEVIDFNVASLKFITRIGFKKEGCFKKHILKNDDYHDIIHFALLKDEWSNIKEDIKESAFLYYSANTAQ